MADTNYTYLENRSFLVISGKEASSFLQNLISNNIERVTPHCTIYAVLLTAQGKFLHDFFVLAHPINDDSYIIEADRSRINDLHNRLSMYRLRADVSIGYPTENWSVVAAFGHDALPSLGMLPKEGKTTQIEAGIVFVDSRIHSLGARLIGPIERISQYLNEHQFSYVDLDIYESCRLSLGVPAGGQDIVVEKSFPLECNLDELNAIDYTKGCYVGQELTARTHYRANLKKRLIPVHLKGPPPEYGATITMAGKNIGQMRSSKGEYGLALLNILSLKERGNEGDLMSGLTELIPNIPTWLNFSTDS